MRNSGREHFIPAFFEECLERVKNDLSPEQIKSIGDNAMRVSNLRYQEEKQKESKKSKGPKASIKAGKGVGDTKYVDTKTLVSQLVSHDVMNDEEDGEYDDKNDFM